MWVFSLSVAARLDMAKVFISVGSNIDRNRYISAGISALNNLYSPIICSTVYESESVGFDGDNFYNLVIQFNTNSSIDEVSASLARIEDENGRERCGPRFSSRTLVMDLLLYDDQIVKQPNLTLPRPEIYENAFVLLPLSEISDSFYDPNKNQTYTQLWTEFDKTSQKLWPVEFPFPAL